MTASLGHLPHAAATDLPAVAEPPEVLPDLIAGLLPGGQPAPRDVALGLLRRQLGRIQGRVQRAFEAHELSGLAAARWLGALTDGLVRAIHG